MLFLISVRNASAKFEKPTNKKHEHPRNLKINLSSEHEKNRKAKWGINQKVAWKKKRRDFTKIIQKNYPNKEEKTVIFSSVSTEFPNPDKKKRKKKKRKI